MDKREMLKGVLLVAFGASSYGMLAVFVKMAYSEGYTTAEVTLSQVLLGVIAMGLINLFQTKVRKVTSVKIKKRDLPKLLLLGTTLGFTSLFYYLSVRYINVSIAIVLLMQTVWMSVVLEAILSKTFPSPRKIISVVIVLAGTLLATNLIGTEFDLDWRGVFWGLLAAMSFTTTMFTSNKIATYLPAYKKSFIMLLGGLFVICIFALITYTGSFNFAIFLKWGLILSLFGTIIPPIMLNAGFPKTGLGLGSIVASIELPVSVMMAFFLLHESVNLIQFIGIALILAAIVVMNLNFSKK
ncbi:MAG TPA: DMT family transporter [Flavobacterium sp.]|nr:DMT family transporter [Flavobacterium sp.]